MNILVFAHDSSLYGASQSLMTILFELKHKHKFLVILPYAGQIEEILKKEEIEYIIIMFPLAATRTTQLKFQLRLKGQIRELFNYLYKEKKYLHQLKKVAHEFKPQFVYTNTSVVTVGYKISRLFNIPHVWHVREFGWLDYKLKYLPSKQYVLSYLKKSEHVFFVSKSLFSHWFRQGLKNGSVVYNGVVSKESPVTKDKKFPTGLISIGILGALVPGKGQDVALKAFKVFMDSFPNSVLYIYGDEVDKIYSLQIKTLCEELGINEKVKFRLFEKDKEIIYSKLDLLLNCSIMEGFGRTIVEAMSRGIPVIANASGGVPEVIDDGVNGLLYVNDISSLECKMVKIFSNPTYYELISKNAIRKALECYNVDNYVNEIENVFTKFELK